ncbi:hypothetical protein V5N11_009083 [Cardamine amara subsp. amara]|uniref:RNase H type-1 domain-containing protein n=1 Tax=Cardamine amara subsp. amara TaxID=228776 RepID=A0ABD0ZAG3_CARAN
MKEWSFYGNVTPPPENLSDTIEDNWQPPLFGELKCNIGISWSKGKSLAGVSWVVRDYLSNVLFHRRRSYSQVYSCFDAKLKSWEWGLESMKSLHLEKVMFSATSMEIIKAIHNPKDWPAFVGHISPLLSMSKGMKHWFILFEPAKCNIGAYEIAKSVTTDLRLSSYGATGYPNWLKKIFDKEKRNTVGI